MFKSKIRQWLLVFVVRVIDEAELFVQVHRAFVAVMAFRVDDKHHVVEVEVLLGPSFLQRRVVGSRQVMSPE